MSYTTPYPLRLGVDESRIVVLSDHEHVSDIDGVVVRQRTRTWNGVPAFETLTLVQDEFERLWNAATPLE